MIERKIVAVARLPFRRLKAPMAAILHAGIILALMTTPSLADEVWHCTPDLKVPHPKARNVYISEDEFWFAGGSEPYSIVENDTEQVIAFLHAVIEGKTPQEKIEYGTTIILNRSSGRITNIEDSSVFRQFGNNNNVLIFHEGCSKIN